MQFGAMLEAVGLDRRDPAALALLARTTEGAAFDAAMPGDWRRLAVALARRTTSCPGDPPGPLPGWTAAGRPRVLAVSGAQGSGKTTLARALAAALDAAGARALAVSLDDFYLTGRERARLGADVHPLLSTRGVPGTHDIALLERLLDELGGRGTVAVPGFDKGLDDRMPPALWRRVRAPLDVLVIEGWCLGAQPQPAAALEPPCNRLEALEDPHGVWRQYVNAALAGPYARLWQRFDGLVYLRVPDLAAVLRWRTEQEQSLAPERRMNAQALVRFIAHYERITIAALHDVPRRADVVVDLQDDHAIAAIRSRTGDRSFRVRSE